MKTKKTPMRRCAGCMKSKPKEELIRIAWYEGELSLDPSGKAKGRGVYLCKSQECVAKAIKRRAIQRSLQADIKPEQLEKIVEELKAYED